jgi:hypothetical protein
VAPHADTMNGDYDVVVIGASPAGQSAAEFGGAALNRAHDDPDPESEDHEIGDHLTGGHPGGPAKTWR